MGMEKGEKVRLALIGISLSLGLLALSCFIYGAIVVSQSSPSMSLTANAAPPAILYSVFVLLILAFMLPTGLFVGALRKDRKLLTRFVWVAMVSTTIQLAFFVLVVLYGNGIFAPTTNQLSEITLERISSWALNKPQEWIDYQTENNCCGIDLRSTYNSAAGGYSDLRVFQLSEMLNGPRCAGLAINNVQIFQETYPEYDETLDDIASGMFYTTGSRYNCYGEMVQILHSNAATGGYLIGFSTFLFAVTIGCTLMLVYSIKIQNGGLKPEVNYCPDNLSVSVDIGSFDKKKQASFSVMKFDK